MNWTDLLDKNQNLDMNKVHAAFAKDELNEDSYLELLRAHPETVGYFDDQCYKNVIYPSIVSAVKKDSGQKATIDGFIGKKVQTKVITDPKARKENREKAKELLGNKRSQQAENPGENPNLDENLNARPRSVKRRDRGAEMDGIEITSADLEKFGDLPKEVNEFFPDDYDKKLAHGYKEGPDKITYCIGTRSSTVLIINIQHTLTKEDEDGVTKFDVPKVPKALPGTRASSSFLANAIYKNALLSQPFNRQCTDLAYQGLKLEKTTLLDWRTRAVQIYFRPLVELILDELMKQAVIHGDETTWNALEVAKTTYMMALCSGEAEEKQIVAYKFLENRKQETFKEILKDFEGIFVSDNAKWYSAKVIALFLHALCWAHGRKQLDACYKEHKDEIKKYERILAIEDPVQREKEKKAFEMSPNHQTFLILRDALQLISLVYDNEQICRENQTMPDETRMIREELSEIPVNLLFDKLEQLRALPSTTGKTKNASDYWLQNREQFELFLHNGRIDIDNNVAERAIKMLVILRDNCEFSATVEGAECIANEMTIMMTAAVNGLNPELYARHFMDKLCPYLRYDSEHKEYWLDCPDEVFQDLLPWSPKLPKEIYVSSQAWQEVQKRFKNRT